MDVENATYTNSIGDAMLAAHWQDPDFDPKQPAFYYVRLLQIPTPRWTTYDAAFFGIERPKNVPATLQDRAYSSPIWYTPKGWRHLAREDLKAARLGSPFSLRMLALPSVTMSALGQKQTLVRA